MYVYIHIFSFAYTYTNSLMEFPLQQVETCVGYTKICRTQIELTYNILYKYISRVYFLILKLSCFFVVKPVTAHENFGIYQVID